jgi:hypothetical protein
MSGQCSDFVMQFQEFLLHSIHKFNQAVDPLQKDHSLDQNKA